MLDTLLDLLEYAGGFLLVVAVLAFVIWRSRRRDRALAAAAAALGMAYRHADTTLFEHFAGFKVFDTVGTKSLFNVISGTRNGFRVWVADYRYSDKLFGSVENCGCTICLLESEGADLPHFFLEQRSRPRSMVAAPVLRRPEDDPEVRLDADEDFEERFSVRAGSVQAVKALFVPELRERLRDAGRPHLEIEARGSLMVVTERSYLAPQQVDEYIESAAAIFACLRRARSSLTA